MKSFKTIVAVVVALLILWGLWGSAKPFWDRYWLRKDMEAAAIYGTKHSLDQTVSFLNEKMKKEGQPFTAEDFEIEKDENNTVSIRIQYEDEIRAYGTTLKSLDFDVKVVAEEVKDIL